MEDWLKAFDPRKLVESYYGELGSVFGSPFGSFGDFATYRPESVFKLNDYYNSTDFYDAKNILRQAAR